MIDSYLKYLHEGYILSDKTISIDFDKFKIGESNKLLIIGLSGSGKTTLGKYISEKLNVPIRSTDDCPFNWKLYKTSNRDIKDKILNKYWNCCEKMIGDNKPGILEGVGLIEAYWERPNIRNKALKYPCIIIGTSAIKSSMRSSKRADESMFDLHFYKVNFKLYQRMLNRFKKDRSKLGEIKQFTK